MLKWSSLGWFCGTPILGHPHMEWRIRMWTAKHTSLIRNFSSYMLYFLSVRIRGYSGYNISWGSLLRSACRSKYPAFTCYASKKQHHVSIRLWSHQDFPVSTVKPLPADLGFPPSAFFVHVQPLRLCAAPPTWLLLPDLKAKESWRNFSLSDSVNKTAAVPTLVFSSSLGAVSWARHVASQLSFLHSLQSPLTRLQAALQMEPLLASGLLLYLALARCPFLPSPPPEFWFFAHQPAHFQR